MGERTNRIDHEPSVDAAGERVEKSRVRLDTLVSELDQRRHVVSHAKRMLSEHPTLALVAGVAAVGAIGGAIALIVQHHQERELLTAHAGRLRSAMGRMIEHPERVAPAGSTIPGKLIAAAGSAVTTILVKRLFETLTKPATRPDAG